MDPATQNTRNRKSQSDNIQHDIRHEKQSGSDPANFSIQFEASNQNEHFPNTRRNGSSGIPKQGKNKDSYLSNLVENVTSIYQRKLEDAEKLSFRGSGDEGTNRMKVSIMHEWVQDLNEQNSILIETVEEMEDEAETKIQFLESKAQRSTLIISEYMKITKVYEQQVQCLLDQLEEGDKQYDMLRAEATGLEKMRKQLHEKLAKIETDNEMLICLITRIRDYGTWDISGLKFDPKTYKELFNLYPKLPGSKIQTAFTQDRTKELKETEEKLFALKNEFYSLSDLKKDMEKQLKLKEELTRQLEDELKRLQIQTTDQRNENCDLRRALQETQTLLSNALKSNQEIVKADEHDMLKELRELKSELQIACTERQNAMLEASSLRSEINEHLEEINQIRLVLMEIQMDSETTRERVHDVEIKQSELSTLKDEVEKYQEKYKQARVLLANKSEMLQSLQKQMNMLHEKMNSIELIKHFQSSTQGSTSQVIKSPSSIPSKQSSKTGTSLTNSELALALQAMASQRLSEHKGNIGNTNVIEFDSKPPWNKNFIKTAVNTSKNSLKERPTKHAKQKEMSPIPTFYPTKSIIKQSGNTIRGTSDTLSQSRLSKSRGSKSVEKLSIRFDDSKSQEFLHKRGTHAPTRSKCEIQPSGIHSFPHFAAKRDKIAEYLKSRFGISLENIEDRERESGKLETSELSPMFEGDIAKKSKEFKKANNLNQDSSNQKLPNLLEKEFTEQICKESGHGDYQILTNDPFELKTLEALLKAAVQTSKKIISSFGPNQGNMQMEVTASHRKLRATHDAPNQQENLAPATNKNSQTAEQEIDSKLEHGQINCTNPSGENKVIHITNIGDSLDADEILKNLPVQNQEIIIQNWIMKNGIGKTTDDKTSHVVVKTSSKALGEKSLKPKKSTPKNYTKKSLHSISNPITAPNRDSGHSKTNRIFQGISKRKHVRREKEDQNDNVAKMDKEIRIWLNQNFESSEAESSEDEDVSISSGRKDTLKS